MDGPRVKVLSDGAELHDASTISPDHAVVSEPLLATQIEVLRGPSALVYGNGAVGGVVNVLDGKIPTAIPHKGYEGSAELRANSSAREKAGAFSLTGGTGNLAVHVEGVARDAGDYRVLLHAVRVSAGLAADAAGDRGGLCRGIPRPEYPGQRLFAGRLPAPRCGGLYLWRGNGADREPRRQAGLAAD